MYVILLCLILILAFLFLGGIIIYHLTKGKVFKILYHDLLHIHIAKYDLGDNKSVCAVCGRLLVKTNDSIWISIGH
jgi:hypothetical protein